MTVSSTLALSPKPRNLLAEAERARAAGEYRLAALLVHEIAVLEHRHGNIGLSLKASRLAVDMIIRAAADPRPLRAEEEPFHQTLARLIDLRNRIQSSINS